jgi:steroid delta-isomerase-like uncharacterized protein
MMDTRQNRALVERYYDEVLNGRDLAVLNEIVADDYVENDPLPGQGTGRGGLRQRVEMLIDGLDPHFTVEDMIAEGDRVAVRWTNSGTHRKDFLGIPATGRSFTIAGIDIHRIQDGRLAEHWHVVDQLSQLQQLGLLPTPEGPPA